MSNSRIEPTRRRRGRTGALLAALVLAWVPMADAVQVDPQALNVAARDGSVDVLIVLADRSLPTLSPLRANADYRVRRRALVDELRARSERDQASLRTWLDGRGIAHRDFWIANTIAARLSRSQVAQLSRRGDIDRVDYDAPIALELPRASVSEAAASTASIGIPWGIARIGAPNVWAEGITGAGVVIGGEDTGYQWDHPALKAHYRGWNGSSVDHAYNWHDAIHNSTGNPCGNDSPQPCDDGKHGTHTAGTFAGDDGAGNQIGVAPGAKWIGCRNMDRNTGTPSRYIECMQWMLAPTDLAGANPDPDRAPDVVSNSWYCPPAEGCSSGLELQAATNALVAGGIFFVAAAGNDGAHLTAFDDPPDHCGTISGPPGTYDASFVVGATNSSDVLADFSSRGPVVDYESPPQQISSKVRPDVSAPGVGVCSSVPLNSYDCTFQGTSMATPHVAGAAALLISAFPALRGQPERIAALIRATARRQGIGDPVSNESCSGTTMADWPNYMVGYGRLDAWNAYHEIVMIDGFDP